MSNIHTQKVHVPYEKQQYIKKINHYIITYTLNSIPTPAPSSHTHTHTNMKQVAIGMYKSIRRLGGRDAFLG